jgi:transposase-like protein
MQSKGERMVKRSSDRRDLPPSLPRKRCADCTFFGVGGGGIVGAFGGLRHGSISERSGKSNDAAPARRLEIFTGAGRRRAWTAEQKTAIVAESFEDGALISHVARRHGLTPQQVFAWRRQARRRIEAAVDVPAFAQVVGEAASAAQSSESPTTQSIASTNCYFGLVPDP